MRFLCDGGHTYIQNENGNDSTHLIKSDIYSLIFASFNILKITGTLLLSTEIHDKDTSTQGDVVVKIVYIDDSYMEYTLTSEQSLSLIGSDVDTIYCKQADSSADNCYIRMKYLYDYFIDCEFEDIHPIRY